jgi:hypothetical protein
VAAGDADALADMTGLATELDEMISHAVAGLRWAGYSWAEIAARLGVTRQAAQQRWATCSEHNTGQEDRGDTQRRAIDGPLAMVNSGQLRTPKDTRSASSGTPTAAGDTPSKLVMRVRFPSPAFS